MHADTLDLCKENIQPLKQGRKASLLGLALQAQSDADVKEKLIREREQFELSIITYDGDDPIEPRYHYVQWLEQSYPKQGRESNLIPILEDTIMLFKDDDRYKQDPRFIELIIKYIESQENAIELFNMVYSQGIGTMCSIFFKAWAEALDRNRDMKRADQIYQLGIANHSQPIEPLKAAHAQFQLSIARRMMLGELPLPEKQVSSETSERQRKILGKLKKATSVRTTHSSAGKFPVLAPLNKNKENGSIAVFRDDENEELLFGGHASGHKISVINSVSTHKENTMKAGPWNQGFKRREQPVYTPTPMIVPSTPNFRICVDSEEEQTPQAMKSKTPASSKVLKSRKSELHCPLDIFKSPHPGAKSHLPKFEAFAGGREFCFEELRWAHYRKYDEQKQSTGLETPMKRLLQFTPCKGSQTPMHAETPRHPEKNDPFVTPMKRPLTLLFATPLPEEPEEEAKEEKDLQKTTELKSQKNVEKIEIFCDSPGATPLDEIKKPSETVNSQNAPKRIDVFCDNIEADQFTQPKSVTDVIAKKPIEIFCDDPEADPNQPVQQSERVEKQKTKNFEGFCDSSEVGPASQPTHPSRPAKNQSPKKQLDIVCDDSEVAVAKQTSKPDQDKNLEVKKPFDVLCDYSKVPSISRTTKLAEPVKSKEVKNKIEIFCDSKESKFTQPKRPLVNYFTKSMTEQSKLTVTDKKDQKQIKIFCDEPETDIYPFE